MGKRTGAVAAAAVAVVALSSVVIGWWAIVAGAVLLLAGAVALLVVRPADPPPMRMDEEDPIGAEPHGDGGDAVAVAGSGLPPSGTEERPAHRRKHIFREEVPSARADYRFLFSAVVCWNESDDAGPAAEGIALARVAGRAREATAKESPEDYDAAQYRLTALLGEPERCFESGVSRIWADEVRLELSDEDTERLKRLREFRKREADREDQREAERRERTYLGDDVLSDPGRAVVWWAAQHKGDIDEAVEKIGELAVLSSAATGREIPDVYEDLMVRLQSTVAAKEAHAFSPNGAGEPPGTQEGLWKVDARPFMNGAEAVPGGGDGAHGTADDDLCDEDVTVAAPWWVQAVETETSGLDEDERHAFVDALARLLEANGSMDAQEDLRARFGVGDLLADDDGHGEGERFADREAPGHFTAPEGDPGSAVGSDEDGAADPVVAVANGVGDRIGPFDPHEDDADPEAENDRDGGRQT